VVHRRDHGDSHGFTGFYLSPPAVMPLEGQRVASRRFLLCQPLKPSQGRALPSAATRTHERTLTMPRPITVISAPTSAGALAPRPEEAPAALRAAGLNYKLRQAGADVAADPQNAAADALALIDNAPYALHFDSDCIDFADLPICENTDRNVGLPHQTAFQFLPYAAAGPGLQAIPITKIVPHHCAADGSAISTFTHGLVTALIKGWV
jgi:hypothetical protein